MSNSCMGRNVHSLMLSIQHFICRPRRRPPSKVLERLSWRVTCSNHLSFRLLTVARGGSCGPTRKLILLRRHPVVGPVLQVGDTEKLPHALDLMGGSSGELQDLTNRLVDRATACGMVVKIQKNKIMTNFANNISADISRNGQKLEEVTSFKYQDFVLIAKGFVRKAHSRAHRYHK